MSPRFIAIHKVIAAHGASPRCPEPPKHAAATSISNESGENPLLAPYLDAEKSSSAETAFPNFFKSTARVGLSNDQRSSLFISHRRTIASVVTVTKHLPR